MDAGSVEPNDVPNDIPYRKMLARSAQHSYEVQNTSIAMRIITSLVEKHKGYIVSSQIYSQQYMGSDTITSMIPSSSLDQFLTDSSSVALRVISGSSSTEDHTSEYVDRTSRSKNLQVTYDKLISLMEKAQTVQETLLVQHELTKITEQIEITKGRMKYIEQQVAFSRVTINLQQYRPNSVYSPPSWNPLETLYESFGRLIMILQKAIDIFIIVAVCIVVPLVSLVILAATVKCTLAVCKNRLL